MKKTILIMLAIGAIFMTASCSKPAEDVAKDSAPTPEPKKTVEAFGIVEANGVENVSLNIEAQVETVNVKEGQQVKKGDVLLSLNMKAYQEMIRSKQHELSIIKLEAEKMKSENTNPDIQKLENDLDFANSELQKTSEELEIQKKLYESGALSKYEYDRYAKDVEVKKKSAEDIKYSLDSTMRSNDLGSAIQNEKAATIESEIRQLKDKVNRSYLSRNNIICTMENGIVYELGYKAGDSVIPEKKLLSLMDMDTIVVNANVPEEFIKDVKLGAKVEIIPIADKNKIYEGKVLTMAKKAVAQNGETVIPVEISIDNKDSFLLPNFNVDVKIYME